MGRYAINGTKDEVADAVCEVMLESDEVTAGAAKAVHAQILKAESREDLQYILQSIASRHGIDLPFEERGHR